MALIEHLLGCTPEPVAPASGCFFFVFFVVVVGRLISFSTSPWNTKDLKHTNKCRYGHTRTRMHE
jgi:hypothetical protein